MSDEELRREVINRMHELPLKDAGLFILDVAQAMLDKVNNYSPHGSRLMRLAKQDGTLTVVMAKDDLAPMLATAHDALKEAIGA